MAKKKPAAKKGNASATSRAPNYPRHSIKDALRIPAAILDQNAGKPCSDNQAATFLGLKSAAGPFGVEISSGTKYGLLERPASKQLAVSDLGKKVLRPMSPTDEVEGYREAVLNAPIIADVYRHYRGEHLPDQKFFDNTLEEQFGIPKDKLTEFKAVFDSCLSSARLLEEHDGKTKVLDSASSAESVAKETAYADKLGSNVTVPSGETVFVMMPFADPIGSYYESILKPAIEKVKLTPVRADNEIFGAGKIMDQIWRGIRAAKILVAELTTRNPNVFYELGIAHALQKPVVLISSNEDDVPFDLKHIRVIIYDKNDPFWGQKLMNKVTENIISALDRPEEAVFHINGPESKPN